MRSTAAPRGVIGGAVLLTVGAAFLLPPLGVANAGAYLFVALGLAFGAAWWLGTKQFVYLVPAGVLTGFGLGLVLPTLFDLPAEIAGPVFLGTLALGLIVVFAFAPGRRLLLAMAAILAVVAVADLLLNVVLIPAGAQPYFVPLILIVVGLYLLMERRGR